MKELEVKNLVAIGWLLATFLMLHPHCLVFVLAFAFGVLYFNVLVFLI